MEIESPYDALQALRRIRESAALDPSLDHSSYDYREFRLVTARLIAQLILASSRTDVAECQAERGAAQRDTIDKLTALLDYRR